MSRIVCSQSADLLGAWNRQTVTVFSPSFEKLHHHVSNSTIRDACFRKFSGADFLACSTDDGSVDILRIQPGPAVVQKLLVKTPRSCRSVAWNKTHLNKLACAYYDSAHSESTGLLWDIETGSCSKLSFSEEVTVASWMEVDSNVVLFATRGNIRLFDIRSSSARSGGLMIQAHGRFILSLAPSPQYPHLLLSYSDGADEAIKIWDCRMLSTYASGVSDGGSSLLNPIGPVLEITPSSGERSYGSSLHCVRWLSPRVSRSRHDIVVTCHDSLAVLTFDVYENMKRDGVQEYVRKKEDLSCPSSVRPMNARVVDICLADHRWCRKQHDDDVDDDVTTCLISGSDGNIVPIQWKFPSCISHSPSIALECRTVYTIGKKIVMTAAANTDDDDDDGLYSCDILNRVKNGYGLETGFNIQVLVNEIDELIEGVGLRCDNMTVKTLIRHRNIWNWVSRTESILDHLNGQHDDSMIRVQSEIPQSTLNGLALSLTPTLVFESICSQVDVTSPSVSSHHPSLFVPHYTSRTRCLTRFGCGWHETQLDSSELDNEDVSVIGDLDREICISVFHGHLQRAVTLLVQDSSSSEDHTDSCLACSNEDAVILASILSGFSSLDGKSDSRLWQMMCSRIRSNFTQAKNYYLAVCCDFIIACAAYASNAGLSPFRDWCFASSASCPERDRFNNLWLSDRLAFACSFLEDSDLQLYIKNEQVRCILQCDLEGVCLCNFPISHTAEESKLVSEQHYGINLLQAYLDKYDDIQLSTLLACKLHLTSTVTQEWIDVYRQLLNRLQCWNERVKFDLALVDPLKPPPAKRSAPLVLRCTFCNNTYPQVTQEKAAADGPKKKTVSSSSSSSSIGQTVLGRSAPIQSTCPGCQRQLTKCFVCLESVSVFVGGDNKKRTKMDCSIDFGDWLCFCQKCKHGGHFQCLSDWFDKHGHCGVIGCSCVCRNSQDLT